MLPSWALLFLAGGVGTLARWGLSTVVDRWRSGPFPLGTLAVNGLGCLVFGLVWSLGEGDRWFRPDQRLAILTGFLGAFTTFSTFAFDTVRLFNEERPEWAMVNLVVQNSVGLGLIIVGLRLGRLAAA